MSLNERYKNWVRMASASSFTLLVLFSFPILPNLQASQIVIIFAFFTLLTFFLSEKKRFSKVKSLELFVFVLLPLLYFLELIYSDDFSFVWSILERKLALFVFPVLIYLLYASKVEIDIKKCLNVFIASTVFLSAFALIRILFQGFVPGSLESGGLAFAIRHTTEVYTGVHPTYFGMYLAFSAGLLGHQILSKNNVLNRTLTFGLFVFLVLVLIFLSARMAIVSAFFVIIYLLILYKEEALKYRYLILSLFFSALIFGLLYPPIRMRVMEIFVGGEHDSTSIRTIIWSCSFEQLKGNWVFGAGVENLQNNLNLCYQEKGEWEGMNGVIYNSHNEYLNILLGRGVFGLISFLLLISFAIRKIKINPPLALFLIVFLTICFTENLLERQFGVFFFGLIGSVLFFYAPDRQLEE